MPELDVPNVEMSVCLPIDYTRQEEPALPEVSELDLIRHYTELSTRNYGVDSGFYPLGSCTMKYNPKINEQVAKIPGFSHIHPLQPTSTIQGALELMYDLQEHLQEITGMDAVTLQPAAGAHGEWTGLMMIRAYHEAKGDFARTKVIIPDSAHGTNPASATVAGFETVTVRSGKDGLVDLDHLQELVGDETAAFMLTNPNTLGLFEEQIVEMAEIIHNVGGKLYYDGANLNAVMSKARPGDMGFDVVHLNLHKTFTGPHGGGGPGSGPVGVKKNLFRFYLSQSLQKGDQYVIEDDRPASIGRVKPFMGTLASMFVLIRIFGRWDQMG
ncbi:aminomethyl-transferring glycine dehydrogenase subunit GcvPB [Bacillus sp. N9]